MCQKQSSFAFTTQSLFPWGQWPLAGTMTDKSSYRLTLFTICVAIAPKNLSYLSSPGRGGHSMPWQKNKAIATQILAAVASGFLQQQLARESRYEATRLEELKWDSVRIGISGLGCQTPSPRITSWKCRERYLPSLEMQRWYCVCWGVCGALVTVFSEELALLSLQSRICRVRDQMKPGGRLISFHYWINGQGLGRYQCISTEVFLVSVDSSTFEV